MHKYQVSFNEWGKLSLYLNDALIFIGKHQIFMLYHISKPTAFHSYKDLAIAKFSPILKGFIFILHVRLFKRGVLLCLTNRKEFIRKGIEVLKMYKPRLYQLLRFIIVITLTILGYLLLTVGFSYLYPLLIASILAMAINPVANFFEEKWKLPRMMAVSGTMLFTFAFLSSIVFILFSEFMQGTTFLATHLPDYVQTFSNYVTSILDQKIMPLYEKMTTYLQALDTSQQEAINNSVKHITEHISAKLSESLQFILLQIPSLFTALPSSFTVTVFILLAAFLIANDYQQISLFSQKIIPHSLQTKINSVQMQFKKTVIAYVKAQLILVIISAVLVYIGLKLLHVNHAFTISLYVAFVDLIPYVGSGIIFFPWMIYLFIVGDHALTIQLAILYGSIVIVRQIIEPKILSSSMGTHPLVALIILFIGLQIWGIIGFIIAPLILISIQAFYQAGIFQDVWKFIKG